MKIKIYSPKEDKNIHLNIPTFFITNHLSSYLFHHATKKADVSLSYSQIRSLTNALKKTKKAFGEVELVKTESKDGEVIEVIL